MSRLRFITLVGPTGAGKSALALRIAGDFGMSVVNADSRQIYTAFPVITAQPSVQQQAACPHLLYGFLPTREALSAGAWAELALSRMRGLQEQGRLPLLVGGTGLYIRALVDGMVAIPKIPAGVTRRFADECARGGPEKLHERLRLVDPEYAARIHPRDRQRVVRALEVFEATGKTFSWWHAQTPPPLDADILHIGVKLPLDTLTPLLAARIDHMVQAGALEEARAEFAECPDDAPGWSGIGCRELLGWLRGKHTLAEARDLWIRNTRAYAKRQLTWFNADSRVHWFAPSAGSDVSALVSRWLRATA